MKTPVIIACTVFAIGLLISCKKSQKVVPDNTPGTVMGRWGLAVDSMGTPFNYTPGLILYKGVPTDYFDFRTDGKLYINEGPYGHDTVAFNVLSDSTVELTRTYPNGVYGPWQNYINPWIIRTLTNHKLIISAWTEIPGGPYCACRTQEVIVLSK